MLTEADLTARMLALVAANKANPDDPALADSVVTLAIEIVTEFWDRQVRVEKLLEDLVHYSRNADERARPQ